MSAEDLYTFDLSALILLLTRLSAQMKIYWFLTFVQSSLKPDLGPKPGFETKSKRGPAMGSRYRTWDRESEVGPSWNRFWNRESKQLGIAFGIVVGNRGPMEVEVESGIETTWKPKWNRLRSCYWWCGINFEKSTTKSCNHKTRHPNIYVFCPTKRCIVFT